MESSVCIENVRENVNLLSTCLSQMELISHCGREKAFVREWVNFVYCLWYIVFRNQSLVSIVYLGGGGEEYPYQINQWHEYSFLLRRFPGIWILGYVLAKIFWFFYSILWKISANILASPVCFLTQCSVLNLKCHIHSVPLGPRTGFE